MLYLGVSETHEAQLNIIQALTRKFRLDPSLDLAKVANRCPFNYTGADFYALCSDAMLKAMSRKAEEIDGTIGQWAVRCIMFFAPFFFLTFDSSGFFSQIERHPTSRAIAPSVPPDASILSFRDGIGRGDRGAGVADRL